MWFCGPHGLIMSYDYFFNLNAQLVSSGNYWLTSFDAYKFVTKKYMGHTYTTINNLKLSFDKIIHKEVNVLTLFIPG